MKSSGLELSNRADLFFSQASREQFGPFSPKGAKLRETSREGRREPRGGGGGFSTSCPVSQKVLSSHRGVCSQTVADTRNPTSFSPKEREREEGRGEPAESRRRIRICQSANATHPVPCELRASPIASSPFSRSPFPVRVRSLNRPPLLSRGHGSARGTAKGDPVVSGAGSARSGQQRVRVLGGGCSGPDRDLGRSRLFSWTWTWIRDWRWRWRWSTSSHLSPPCRPIAFRPRRQFRPHLLSFSQSLLRPPARPLPPDRLVAHRHRSHQLGQAPCRGRRLRRRRRGLGLRQAAEEQAESRVSRLFFMSFCCSIVSQC